MPRLMLTDELWSKLKAILLADRVYNKSKHKQTMQGILYRLRVGCPWRDLPECSSTPVIPRKKNSKASNTDIDWCLYKYKHLVENTLARQRDSHTVS